MPITQDRMKELIDAAKDFREQYNSVQRFVADGNAQLDAGAATTEGLWWKLVDFLKFNQPDYLSITTVAQEEAHYKATASRNIINRRAKQRQRGKSQDLHDLPTVARPTRAQVHAHMQRQVVEELQVTDYTGPLPGAPKTYSEHGKVTEVEFDDTGVAKPEDLAEGLI